MSLLTDEEIYNLEYDWGWNGRPKQFAPPGNWITLLLCGGRASGKSRAANEWIRDKAFQYPGCRIALASKSAADCRDVIVEGESGILAISHPDFKPHFQPSMRRLTWPNGSMATLYSSEEPDQFRGPQHHFAQADELASWRDPAAWSNLMFGLRLGKHPQVVAPTTPRPTMFFKGLMKNDTTCIVRMSSYENRSNLAPSYFSEILRQYEGTRLGNQEINAEILEDTPGALWNTGMFEQPGFRIQLPDANVAALLRVMKRIVVAVDPSVASDLTTAEKKLEHSERKRDECGIIVAGVGKCDCLVRAGKTASPENHMFVFADHSGRMNPDVWARAAVKAYNDFGADRLLAERNNGGALVEATIRTVDPRISYESVWASRGKETRAQPIAAMYEQRRVHHVGLLPLLEAELSGWDPLSSIISPGRLDALVWAGTKLLLGPSQAVWEPQEPITIWKRW